MFIIAKHKPALKVLANIYQCAYIVNVDVICTVKKVNNSLKRFLLTISVVSWSALIVAEKILFSTSSALSSLTNIRYKNQLLIF